MSYILDALRRAQNERSQSQPLAPQATPGPDEPLPVAARLLAQPLLAALAGAGALALVLLLIWLLWPVATEDAPASSAAPAPVTPAVAAAPAVAIPPTETAAIVSMDDLAVSDTPAYSEDAAALPALEPVDVADDAYADPEAADPDAAANPAIADTAAESDATPETTSQTVTVEPAAQGAVKTLREMPDDYRAAFPRLKLEVHVHDADPGARFVIIGGRRYREGERLAEGPEIAEITGDGVIFSFRNAEVMIPVGY